MNNNRIKRAPVFIALTLFMALLLLLPSSCLITGEKDEAEIIENFIEKVAAVDGEMTVVTKGGDNVTITITKGTVTNGQADDSAMGEPEKTGDKKDSSDSIDLSSILPSLECIMDVFEILGVGEDAYILREKGLSWSHVAAELGYGQEAMYADLLEIAEGRLKDAEESGLISHEMLEKKFAYFSEIALKWVNKIFADTYEKETDEGENEIKKLEGTIKAIDGYCWKVINENNVWLVDVSEAEIIREPAVGLRAYMVGFEKGDVFVALEVEIEVVEKEDKIIHFDGKIKLIDGHIWKVYVEDEVWVVDVSEAEIIREPAVGLMAYIAAIERGDILVAFEVEIEAVEKNDTVVEFDGTIKLIDGHIWKVYVEDEIWLVDVSEASIRVEPEVGLKVVVAGFLSSDKVIAIEIDEA